MGTLMEFKSPGYPRGAPHLHALKQDAHQAHLPVIWHVPYKCPLKPQMPIPIQGIIHPPLKKNFIVIPWYHSSWNKYFCWFRMYYFYYLYAKTQKARTCLECTTTFVTAQTSLVWCTWWACTQPKHILPMLFTLPSQIWLVCEFVASLVWCHRRNKHQGMFLCS